MPETWNVPLAWCIGSPPERGTSLPSDASLAGRPDSAVTLQPHRFSRRVRAILAGLSDPDPRDVSLRELEDARVRVAGIVHRTPVLSSATAATWTTAATGVRLGDDRLYMKAEHLQKTGSFKARGMTNR